MESRGGKKNDVTFSWAVDLQYISTSERRFHMGTWFMASTAGGNESRGEKEDTTVRG